MKFWVIAWNKKNITYPGDQCPFIVTMVDSWKAFELFCELKRDHKPVSVQEIAFVEPVTLGVQTFP